MNQIYVSPSPHVHSKDTVEKNMYGVLIALVPAFICSVIFFGYSSLIVTLTSVVACVGIEYLIQKFMFKKEPTIKDGSALVTGILLAFNLPANTPVWIIIIGALAAIGIGKLSFGGLGCNIFNPALVGRVFLLISFPSYIAPSKWPVPQGFSTSYVDAVSSETPLSLIKIATKSGDSIASLNLPSCGDMLLGNMGGSLGEVAALALLLGLAYMLVKKIITWHIPVTIIATVLIFSGILYLSNSEMFVAPHIHLLTGGLLLGAIFMATDYVTSPMNTRGMVIYGIGIGILTVIIRDFGAFPEGMSFAILIMNACTPLINRYCKPKRFA